MMDPLENDLFDLPDYENTVDEQFPPLPPPHSPGAENGDLDAGDDWANPASQTPKEEAPKPTRRAVKRPQPKLDAQRLISQRGLPALRNLFDGVKFKGKGHEAEDLNTLLRHMENWAHRLFPKLRFEDFLNRLETLGGKKEVQTCLKRIRMDLPIVHEDFTSEDVVVQTDDDLGLPSEDYYALPAPSPPSATPQSTFDLSEETQKRIERNRLLALERRMVKKQADADSQAVPPPVLSQTLTCDTDEIPEDFDADFLEAVDKVAEISNPHQELDPIASPGEAHLDPENNIGPQHDAGMDTSLQAQTVNNH